MSIWFEKKKCSREWPKEFWFFCQHIYWLCQLISDKKQICFRICFDNCIAFISTYIFGHFFTFLSIAILQFIGKIWTSVFLNAENEAVNKFTDQLIFVWNVWISQSLTGVVLKRSGSQGWPACWASHSKAFNASVSVPEHSGALSGWVSGGLAVGPGAKCSQLPHWILFLLLTWIVLLLFLSIFCHF